MALSLPFKQAIQTLYRAVGGSVRHLYALGYFNRSGHDQYEFLPSHIELLERPPSPTARITAMTISALILLTLTWAYWGQLDIHATAQGRLVLPSRSQLIQSYELSEVVDIRVKDGQPVKAGDTLLVLNIVGSDQEILRCHEQKSFQQLALTRYQALLSDDPLKNLTIPEDIKAPEAEKCRIYLTRVWQAHQAMLNKFDTELAINQAEQAANQASINHLQNLLHNIEQRLIPYRQLIMSNVISKTELLTKEKESLEAKLLISTKRKELKILHAKADNIQKNKAGYLAKKHREWYDNLSKSESGLFIAEQELAKAQERGRLQTLRAPLDGLVQQMAVHTIGGIVQSGQTLMIIAPHDAPQQAEIDIANKHIGFIHPGQSVIVKIEAFPYSRYGTINGKVLVLSRDSIKRNGSENTELVFPAQVELDHNYIMIGGKSVILTPGMTISVEIKIGKRKVIDYLLSPIREYKSEAWGEP